MLSWKKDDDAESARWTDAISENTVIYYYFMYFATARDYSGGGDSSTRPETTTTIGFWTRRIGIGAAGRTLTQRNSWYRTDWAVVGTTVLTVVVVVAVAAEVVPALLLARRSLTRWLAGGPAGNTTTTAPPPPRVTVELCDPPASLRANRPALPTTHSWTHSVGDPQTYNYRIMRPTGFFYIFYCFVSLFVFYRSNSTKTITNYYRWL